MRRLLIRASAAVLLCVALAPTSAFADNGADCRAAGLARLRASSPGGYAIYRQTNDAAFFASWIDCGDAQYDLPTAVHESTHLITAETDAFPLVGGGSIARPHAVSGFFAPWTIADRFEADAFTAIYLTRGKASSSTDFLYLLDEFNAYTHDLDTAVDLRALASPDQSVDHRDGLAAMMAFVAAYADRAEASEPDSWAGLREPEVATTISALWGRAERVMARSCGIPGFGTSDKAYIRSGCGAGPHSALARILGRAPVCPVACLQSGADEAPTESAQVERQVDEPVDGQPDDSATISPVPSTYAASTDDPDGDARITTDRPRHPFAGAAGARRHRLASSRE